MLSRKAAKIAAGLVSAFVVAGTPAEACQICTAIGFYSMLPFGVIWFYLLIAWAGIALVADFRASASEGPASSSLLHSKSALLLGLAVIVLSVAGLHFVALLAFPFVLAPYFLPARFLARPNSRLRALQAPTWLRRAGQGTAAALALSLVPAYSLFPEMLAEAQTRAVIARARTDMRQAANWLVGFKTERQFYPEPIVVIRDGTPWSLLDINSLKLIAPDRSNDDLWYLTRDLFVHRRRPLPALMAVPIFLPYSLSGFRWEYVERDTKSLDRNRYLKFDNGFVLWSRGPDGEFSDGLPDHIKLVRNGDAKASAALASMTYDPTNGTVSAGDIFLIGPDSTFGWPPSR